MLSARRSAVSFLSCDASSCCWTSSRPIWRRSEMYSRTGYAIVHPNSIARCTFLYTAEVYG
ncbi:MAG: hypothetical protein ACLQDY_30230, partial [Streptosporangiaceae bacterium]